MKSLTPLWNAAVRPLPRLLVACGAFFVITLTSLLLVLLEALAMPLRYVNNRCLAGIAAIHRQEIGR
ncbi:MAG TPA: hypothetical protein VGR92_06060 [Steroidobacteraceae bacterium]|nr:hypothetical protein [Steroidobacteraceae bacterium]